MNGSGQTSIIYHDLKHPGIWFALCFSLLFVAISFDIFHGHPWKSDVALVSCGYRTHLCSRSTHCYGLVSITINFVLILFYWKICNSYICFIFKRWIRNERQHPFWLLENYFPYNRNIWQWKIALNPGETRTHDLPITCQVLHTYVWYHSMA